MIFGRNKEKEIAKAIEEGRVDQSYWAIVKRQFYKNKLAVWSLRFLYVLIFIGIFSDFIANEKPLFCTIKMDSGEEKTFSPVLKQYAVNLGLAKWEPEFFQKEWIDHEYKTRIMPLIPYSATTQDTKNRFFVGPFDDQDVESWRWRHWLGTDKLGRDVMAGMVAGTRVAMMVGIIAMTIATIIGVFLGALSGYFGDDRLKMSRGRVIMNILGLVLGVFYGFVVRGYAIADGLADGNILPLFTGFFIMFLCMIIANVFAYALKFIPWIGDRVTIAMDILVMRFIEVINSIPVLLLILSIVAVVPPSIFFVMVIIGFIGWTGIARFIRAELLRVRNLEYIEAAQAMGFSELRVILRHAIPNALTPVLITIAFGVASAILTEAFLSFLGIGVRPEDVTWGSLLSLARSKFDAWWLAIFPGVAIFITVTLFNLLGEGLTDALDPRLKQ